MKTLRLIILLFIVPYLAFAQSPLTIKLWECKAPYSNDNSKPGIETTPGNVNNNGQAEIIIFRPEPATTNGSAVVICPGGAYSGLSMNLEGFSLAKWFNSFGVTAIVLKYRLPIADGITERDKAPLADAQRAIRYVRSKAVEWGLNTNQIGIMGFSAGGNLAVNAGTHYDEGNKKATDQVAQFSCRPDFMLLIYPVISMEENLTHGGSRKNLLGTNPDPEKVKYYSGDQNVTETTPPAFIVHATDDGAVKVENSINMYLALHKLGIPVEMHIYEKGGHGFGLDKASGTTLKWPESCKLWMTSRKLL